MEVLHGTTRSDLRRRGRSTTGQSTAGTFDVAKCPGDAAEPNGGRPSRAHGDDAVQGIGQYRIELGGQGTEPGYLSTTVAGRTGRGAHRAVRAADRHVARRGGHLAVANAPARRRSPHPRWTGSAARRELGRCDERAEDEVFPLIGERVGTNDTDAM